MTPFKICLPLWKFRAYYTTLALLLLKTKIQCMSRLSFVFVSFRFRFALYVYSNLPRLKFTYLFKNVSLVVLQHYNIIFILASFSFEENFISPYSCKSGGHLLRCLSCTRVFDQWFWRNWKMRNVYNRLTIWLNWSLTAKISAHSDLYERIKGSFF